MPVVYVRSPWLAGPGVLFKVDKLACPETLCFQGFCDNPACPLAGGHARLQLVGQHCAERVPSNDVTHRTECLAASSRAQQPYATRRERVDAGEWSPSAARAHVRTVAAMPYAADYREAARYTGLAENLNRQAALLSGWSVASQVGSGPSPPLSPSGWHGRPATCAGRRRDGARGPRLRERADVCELYRQAVARMVGAARVRARPLPRAAVSVGAAAVSAR